MNNNVAPQHKELILKAIAYHFPDAKVILFGSRARGTHKQGSDIDLALNIGEPIKLREMARIRVTLANLPIPLEMDIVDIHNIPNEFKEKILREGLVWKD